MTSTPSEELKPSDIVDVPHPSVYIREEMDERDWAIPTMARHMGGDYGTNVFALQMYLSIGPANPGLRLGDMAADIAHAFGTSVELFQNMEAAWLKHVDRRPASSRRERQFCLTCGTVTMDDACHCTEAGQEPKFVNYADHMASECVRLTAPRREVLEEAARMADEAQATAREEISLEKAEEGYDPYAFGSGFLSGELTAAVNIAKAIRALAEEK
jgi:hypothetical protein